MKTNLTLARNYSAPSNERGATMVEYALLLGLVALLAIGAVKQTGRQSSAALQRVAFTTTATGGGGVRPLVTHGYSSFTGPATFVPLDR